MSKNIYRYTKIFYWVRKLVFSQVFQKIPFLSENFKRKIIFYSIFKSNHWRDYNIPNKDESVSGVGSDYIVTKKFIVDLNTFIKKNKISTILDIACGDFNWMKHLINSNVNIKYLGLEIVKEIVNKNFKLYSNSRINFCCIDVLNEDLPNNYDLIIVRDFFIHIKNIDIINMINKIKSSNCKYFAINNFPTINKNNDVKGYGHHRLINIEIDPFVLDNSYCILNDYDRKLNIYKNI